MSGSEIAVGVVNVRVYRPFVEEVFLALVPKSVKTVGVLGQVMSESSVSDTGVQSILYRDVLAAFAFAEGWPESPKVVDIKYPREQIWTPISIASAFQFASTKPLLSPADEATTSALQLFDPEAVQQYTFWNLDESTAADASAVFSQAVSTESIGNVMMSTKFDNMVQGGIQRTDIRKSKRSLDAPYPVEGANAIFIEDESILKGVDALASLRFGGKVLVHLPGVKDEDLEKKLPVLFRRQLKLIGAELFLLDSSILDLEGGNMDSYLTQLAFSRVAIPSMESTAIQKLGAINGSTELFEALSEKLSNCLRQVEVVESWSEAALESDLPKLPTDVRPSSLAPFAKHNPEPPTQLTGWQSIARGLAFKEAYRTRPALRPDLGVRTWTIRLHEHRRLTPVTYDRNIMHLEFDIGDSGLEYHIGDSLGIHPRNTDAEVQAFIASYGLDPDAIVHVPSKEDPSVSRASTVYHALAEHLDLFGRPARQFYEALADHATDPNEKKNLLALGGPEGAVEFKRRAEVDTITHADVLDEFPSARPSITELVKLVAPLKRREYSIASCQAAAPTRIALMIVTVNWTDPRGRDRFGLATRYLDALRPGDPVTVSLKPRVMKLPADPAKPIILAGLGTGLAPFRAFAQKRALERAAGVSTGPILLYMGSRHQREEYCFGEEWEAYRDAGVVGLLSCAFSRDQPWKVYIQDRMRETARDIEAAYVEERGSFYLCGPTWPVPDVQNVLEETIAAKGKREGRKVNARKEIERLKEEGRYVLEVY